MASGTRSMTQSLDGFLTRLSRAARTALWLLHAERRSTSACRDRLASAVTVDDPIGGIGQWVRSAEAENLSGSVGS